MIKYLTLSLLFFTGDLTIFSQKIDYPEDKVKCQFILESAGKNPKERNVVAVITCVPQWHIGPLRKPANSFVAETSFELSPSKFFKTVGAPSEPKPIEFKDEELDEVVAYHEGTFKFKQKITLLTDEPFDLNGSFNYVTCFTAPNARGTCLPRYKLNFSLKVKPDLPSDSIGTSTDSNQALTPAAEDLKDSTSDQTAVVITSAKNTNNLGNSSIWTVFILAFLSGFAALIMPCVFPMIPMTVSFFLNNSKSKRHGFQNALLYGFFIILIHVLLALLVIVTGSASLLNEMATNPWFNGIFFALIFIFGLSFLGGFEILLPSSIVNKVNNKANMTSYAGIFFLALVLSLASFSCTGPILGTLLVGITASGGATGLLIGMFAFGLALALPFIILAAFPSLINSIPKSGGWLNTVKVALGFLEVAFSLTYLSKVDTSLQLHLLHRESFLAIEIGLFAVLTFYLLGFIRLPHDSVVEKLSVVRVLFGTFSLAFTLYLLPGLWGAPLNLVNGYLPPDFYAESPGGLQNANAGGYQTMVDGMEKGPLNIGVFKDYDKALAYAKKVNKPLLLDFTGWNCINCRAMEQQVWGKPGVIEHLRNDVVIVSLYVDEAVELPPDQQKTIIVDGRSKELITYGDKWSAKQIMEYKVSAQPYYVMQTPDGKNLSNGAADYQNHGDPEVFKQWLEKGIQEFQK
jgi:thiol:disulfide interchange protein